MNSQELTDILLVIQIIITLLISGRAFYHYSKLTFKLKNLSNS
jgi:hypothetical protein